jgi:hypothetical protein
MPGLAGYALGPVTVRWIKEYQRFMHEEIEEEIEEFYQGPYLKPVLGSKEFIGRSNNGLEKRPGWKKRSPNRGGFLIRLSTRSWRQRHEVMGRRSRS